MSTSLSKLKPPEDHDITFPCDPPAKEIHTPSHMMFCTRCGWVGREGISKISCVKQRAVNASHSWITSVEVWKTSHPDIWGDMPLYKHKCSVCGYTSSSVLKETENLPYASVTCNEALMMAALS